MSLTQDVKEGSILVGHGLLLPSALFLEKKLPIDEGRLLDFGSLLNALVLHDKLVTLPATVPDHILKSKLYSYLEERDLLYTLDISFNEIETNEIKEMMQRYQMKQKDAKTVLGDLRTAPFKYVEKWDLKKLEEKEKDIKDKRSKLIDGILASQHKDLLAADDDRNYLLGSKEEGMRIHSLRTIFYAEISDHTMIPFMPDFLRIPILAGYDNLRLYQSYSLNLETTADKDNIKKAEKIRRKTQRITIPIPGVTAKFLKIYNEKHELPETIDRLREEFCHKRKFVVEVEKKRRSGASMAELEKLGKQMESGEASLISGNGEDVGEIVLTGLETAEEALGGGMPLGKGGKLFMMLAKNFKKLYYRGGRTSYFYSNKQEAYTITNLEELLRDTFRGSLDVSQKSRFLHLAKYLYELIKSPESQETADRDRVLDSNRYLAPHF
jgi:hypothetical protein